jgi:glycosyltransferase involved in cell wall biosynthesis
MSKRAKVLLVIESCNPDWASVPLVGYHFYQAIARFADVKLVTHARNKPALVKRHPEADIEFIEPGAWESRYYRFVHRCSHIGSRTIWPIYHALFYPIYYFFNRAVQAKYNDALLQGKFDLLHVITPMMPRYPVAISKACLTTPFILGPVNGGIPFPEAFANRGRREFSQLNFLRTIGRYLIPDYRNTYQRASCVLAGSEYTQAWLAAEMAIPLNRLKLVFENAVADHFFGRPPKGLRTAFCATNPLRLLFSGRLVPYKGCDMVLNALARLAHLPWQLTILGDGPERDDLTRLVQAHRLTEKVTFAGWVDQADTANYYGEADVFVFPSVREFGGAVVMEAMASGLACIIVNYGGIGEYVMPDAGFKIEPLGEDFVIAQIAKSLEAYLQNPSLLHAHQSAARQHAKAHFSWQSKSILLEDLYQKMLPTDERS